MMNTKRIISHQLRQAVTEILTKECERYELEKGGFVKLCDELIDSFINHVDEDLFTCFATDDYEQWREKLLNSFYAQHNYSSYFRKQHRNKKIYLLTKNLSRNAVGYLHSNNKKRTIDAELRMLFPRTFAFKLSSMHFAEIYPSIISGKEIISIPSQIEDRCRENMKNTFPLQHTQLTERIEKQDGEFWNELSVLTSNLVGKTLQIKRPDLYSPKNRDEISNEVLAEYHEHVDAGKLHELNSAEHLYYSLRQFCIRRIKAFSSKINNRKEEIIDENAWLQLIDEELNDSSSHDFHLDSIDNSFDPANEYLNNEVSIAIVKALCEGKGKLYDALTKGIERNVSIFMMYKYEGLSYEEIVLKAFGKNTEQNNANVRKIVSRTPKMLQQRIEKLAKENKIKS